MIKKKNLKIYNKKSNKKKKVKLFLNTIKFQSITTIQKLSI